VTVDPFELFDSIDIRPCLRELDALPLRPPPVDVALPGVVGGEGVLLVVVLVQQVT